MIIGFNDNLPSIDNKGKTTVEATRETLVANQTKISDYLDQSSHLIFSKAQIPLRYNMRQLLKRDVNDDSIDHVYNPKIGIPSIVDGALNKNDIMRLQKLKQEIFPETINLQKKRMARSNTVSVTNLKTI